MSDQGQTSKGGNVMKSTILISLIYLTVLLLLLIITDGCKEKKHYHILLEEGFETTTTQTFPSERRWTATGVTNHSIQLCVSDYESHTGNKSLMINGLNGNVRAYRILSDENPFHIYLNAFLRSPDFFSDRDTGKVGIGIVDYFEISCLCCDTTFRISDYETGAAKGVSLGKFRTGQWHMITIDYWHLIKSADISIRDLSDYSRRDLTLNIKTGQPDSLKFVYSIRNLTRPAYLDDISIHSESYH